MIWLRLTMASSGKDVYVVAGMISHLSRLEGDTTVALMNGGCLWVRETPQQIVALTRPLTPANNEIEPERVNHE